MRYLSLFSILLCLGCSGGFTVPGGSSSSNSRASSGTPGSYEALQYQGNIAGGPNDGVLAINLDKKNAAMILVLPLQLNAYIEPAEGTVPTLSGVKFETYKDSKGKSYFAVSVPLHYVLKGASFLPVARLPNGDALPQVAEGALPSIAVKVPGRNNVQFNLYLGEQVVGVYLSSPFDPYLPLRFPVRNGTTDIGSFHSVPMVGEFNGGFFLTTTLPPDVAATIDDYFHF